MGSGETKVGEIAKSSPSRPAESVSQLVIGEAQRRGIAQTDPRSGRSPVRYYHNVLRRKRQRKSGTGSLFPRLFLAGLLLRSKTAELLKNAAPFRVAGLGHL